MKNTMEAQPKELIGNLQKELDICRGALLQ